jgi:hypothetical protein
LGDNANSLRINFTDTSANGFSVFAITIITLSGYPMVCFGSGETSCKNSPKSIYLAI